ncbi:MAG: hypothetical protein IJ874_07315 [Ruminococcus sp.]|nr:hypothetical protein [Ruminococcus sp.]
MDSVRDYQQYVGAYSEDFLKIKLDRSYYSRIREHAIERAERKAQEELHRRDGNQEFKRIMTGCLGEAALEQLFGMDIINWEIGDSKNFNSPDIPGYRVGIKAVEQGKYPLIFKENYYPQIMCIVSNKSWDTVFVCGLATVDVLNTYQDDRLVLDPNVLRRGTKTGFYGYGQLVPVETIDDIEIYKK